MSLPERTEDRKVTIEDLLRLKRAERPSPEFWTRFEQDLRAKQLAAIVEPRPWWIRLHLPQAARAVARFQVPVGAAAVLALSFVVLREYHPSSAPLVAIESVASSSPDVVTDPLVAAGDSVNKMESSRAAKPAAASSVSPVRVIADRTNVDQPVSIGPGGLMAMIPWAAPGIAPVPVQNHDSATIGELPQVHFASAVNPGRDHDFEGRVEVESVVVATPAPVVEDAAAVVQASPVSPREIRRNRILSSLVVADNTSDIERSRLAQVHEVLTSSLDDDRLYDSVRRVGMGGDRLTLKF